MPIVDAMSAVGRPSPWTAAVPVSRILDGADRLVFDARPSDLGDPMEVLSVIGSVSVEITEDDPDFDDVYRRALDLPGFRADLARGVMDGSLSGPVIVWQRPAHRA